jgi:nitrogen permease regulator 3-like protein
MSSMVSTSAPCLLAILLVTQARTGTGAQIVFHYPPDPLSDQEAQVKGTASTGDDESSSSDSDSESSSDDNAYHTMLRRTKPSTQRQYGERPQISDDDEEYRDAETKTQDQRLSKPPWEPLLGLGEEGLVSLLAPGRAWHKRKFEMGINDLVFVGRPVYSRENGTWRRRKRSGIEVDVEPEQEQPSDTATESEPEELSNPQADIPPSKSPPKRHSGRKSSLTMFHVVFVLHPPPLEHTIKVKEIYDNIVRKFSKILKWEQANHEYVWKQSDLIQGIKSTILPKKASVQTLYAELLARSSLAGAISNIYKSITASRIAAVKLGSEMSTSLQIPPTTSVSYLPSLTDPPIQPGLWLTTANDSLSSHSDLDTATAAGTLQLAKQFSLLLKESPQKIVREVQSTGGPFATPLSTFIDKARPTKSFYKMSVANQISLADIQLLSRHLIYWRRAIAIPPLHHRDTYIVSPNADMSKLVEASKSFEMAFPMMPSLPRILSLLCQTPVPFGTLIPSSDHKEEYYRVLAWLMRGGWVTQLRTFAYVRVDPTIKKAVREKGREERNQHTQTSSPDKSNPDHQHSAPTPPSRRPSIPSRHSSDGRHSISTSTSQSQSQSQSQKPSSTTSPSMASIHTSSLILSPLRASALESKYLTAIADSLLTTTYSSNTLTQTEKEELRMYWPTLVKYFNGSEPLEMLPIREGLKRKFVWDVLGRLGLRFEGGVNDEKGENGGILVTVRHW